MQREARCPDHVEVIRRHNQHECHSEVNTKVTQPARERGRATSVKNENRIKYP